MSTDFRALDREAFERGMRDHERDVPRHNNPHARNAATSERQSWDDGWDNAQSLTPAPVVQLAPAFRPDRRILPFSEFKARMTKLLEAMPEGTAIVTRYDGRMWLDGAGLACAQACELVPASEYDGGQDVDESAWNDETGSFEGETHADTWRYLEAPVFDYPLALAP